MRSMKQFFMAVSTMNSALDAPRGTELAVLLGMLGMLLMLLGMLLMLLGMLLMLLGMLLMLLMLLIFVEVAFEFGKVVSGDVRTDA